MFLCIYILFIKHLAYCCNSISTHDPAALYFKDFLKLGENLPRQTEVEELYKQASMDDLAKFPILITLSGITRLLKEEQP